MYPRHILILPENVINDTITTTTTTTTKEMEKKNRTKFHLLTCKDKEDFRFENERVQKQTNLRVWFGSVLL